MRMFADQPTRRDFLKTGALGLSGLWLPDLLRWQAVAESQTSKLGKAKSVIMLFLSGGPSQLDMWDLKPEAPAEIRGTFQPMATNVPGICKHLIGARAEVRRLERGEGALIGNKSIEKHSVVLSVLHILAEVIDPGWRANQLVVNPPRRADTSVSTPRLSDDS